MYSIYQMTNLTNGRKYIGMTERPMTQRFRKHISRLRAGQHVNDHMQADWNLGHKFMVSKITSRKFKEVAKALETKLMNEIDNPYNIAKGNVGDMVDYIKFRFTANSRPYMYDEINKLTGEPFTQLQQRFHISRPMISLIQNGHRTQPQPTTSFKDVFFCEETSVQVEHPPQSSVAPLYLAAA